jgi:hypothetical protein
MPHSLDCRSSRRHRCRRTHRACHIRRRCSWAYRNSRRYRCPHSRQLCRSLVARNWVYKGSRTCRPRRSHLNLRTVPQHSSGSRRSRCCRCCHTRQSCRTPHPSMSGYKASLQRRRRPKPHRHLPMKRHPTPGHPPGRSPSRAQVEHPCGHWAYHLHHRSERRRQKSGRACLAARRQSPRRYRSWCRAVVG